MTIDPLLLRPILVASLIRTPAHHRSYFGSADPLALTIPVAISLCAENKSRLTLVTVIPDLEVMIETEWSTIAYRYMIDNARVRLEALVDEYPAAEGATVEVACGNIWRGILEVAERAEADLVVLASHRPAMNDYLIGANAVSVVRHAPCSVLVVRE